MIHARPAVPFPAGLSGGGVRCSASLAAIKSQSVVSGAPVVAPMSHSPGASGPGRLRYLSIGGTLHGQVVGGPFLNVVSGSTPVPPPSLPRPGCLATSHQLPPPTGAGDPFGRSYFPHGASRHGGYHAGDRRFGAVRRGPADAVIEPLSIARSRHIPLLPNSGVNARFSSVTGIPVSAEFLDVSRP